MDEHLGLALEIYRMPLGQPVHTGEDYVTLTLKRNGQVVVHVTLPRHLVIYGLGVMQ